MTTYYTALSPNWCVMCGSSNETKDHLFLHYNFARLLWSYLQQEFDLSWVWPSHCQDVLKDVIGAAGFGKKRRKVWNVMVLAILLAIWSERNKRIFNEEEEGSKILWDRIKYSRALWLFKTKDFKEWSFADLTRDWNCWM